MTENVEQTTEETSAEQSGADLTINDLNALKTIIDIASSRGAFKPNEMVAVGQTYTKLDTFLATVTEQAKASGAQ
jgi:cell division protein FtsL